MSQRKLHSQQGRTLAIVAAIVSTVLAILLFVNRQYVVDQIAVWQFRPSAEIAALVSRSSMSDSGKFYFYASKPSLEAASTFNEKCTDKEESTAVLGCYNGQSIYIYDITDSQLDGIRDVTAAHEMLHAAYLRLSDSERKEVDALVETEYAKLKDDSIFAQRMAFYERAEPGERDNELHSIIGTEVGTISGALEKYYKKYFNDRTKVVALHTKYITVFNTLQQKADQLSAQLTTLGDSIERRSAAYNTNIQQLNTDIKLFNEKASSGGFVSTPTFNAERAGLVARTGVLDAERSAINADVDRYNALRVDLEAVASQSEALNRSIDSSLAPAPSV